MQPANNVSLWCFISKPLVALREAINGSFNILHCCLTSWAHALYLFPDSFVTYVPTPQAPSSTHLAGCHCMQGVLMSGTPARTGALCNRRRRRATCATRLARQLCARRARRLRRQGQLSTWATAASGKGMWQLPALLRHLPIWVSPKGYVYAIYEDNTQECVLLGFAQCAQCSSSELPRTVSIAPCLSGSGPMNAAQGRVPSTGMYLRKLLLRMPGRRQAAARRAQLQMS